MLASRVVVGGALLCAWALACSGSESHEFDCAVGSLNCNCGADDHCKEGLVCNLRNQCVKPDTGTAGDASVAEGGRSGASSSGGNGQVIGKAGKDGHGKGGKGAGATGGSSGGDGGGGAAGETQGGTGGMAVSGAAGEGGAGAGGEGAAPGSGGALSGGAGGTAGAGAVSGSGGTSGAGGSDAGGLGGTSGVGGSGAGAAGMSGGESGAGGVGGGSHKCTEIALPATMSLRSYTPNHFRYEYPTTKNVGAGGRDFLTIDFFDAGVFNGSATGKFTLGADPDDNVATCSRCVLGEQDRGTGVSAQFFASSGDMDIADGSNQMNGFPAFTLTDVTLVEVTINGFGVSNPVPDGRCWHLASASVEFPKAWTCDANEYASNDGCDCGCGALDGDCAGSDVNECDWCHCPGDALACSTTSVAEKDNALCE
jgi:hypothetical protein